MSTPAPRDLLPAGEAVRATTLARARNSLRYGVFGELDTTSDTLQRIVEAVPSAVAAALPANAFVFVPLAIGETAHAPDTEIARIHSAELADRAICHRTVPIDGSTYTFISTRLMQDRFALAFEVFINVGHQYVDALSTVGGQIPERFTALLTAQALSDARGETSQDSYEERKRAFDVVSQSGRAGSSPDAPEAPDERRARFFEAALADSLAIYMLSLAIDIDYADLREREYPLLAAPALADRLRIIAELYPPPSGYEFSIRYRRRH